MKKLELKLKKEVLIVEIDNKCDITINKDGIYFYFLNGCVKCFKGNYNILCKGSELTEEIASELVDYWQNMANDGFIFENYKYYLPKKLTANDALISAVESKGFHWLENPIGEEPRSYSEVIDGVSPDELMDNLKEWQEAEEKTFYNPLIFVKK